MAVNVWLYILIPAFSWIFKEEDDEWNFIHISFEGTPVVFEFELNIVN
jgi:hypothetical protein